MITALKRWAHRRLAALRSEGGFSLAEILISVTILGIAIIGLTSAMGTASLASDYHRKQATADTVLKSYAEVLKQRVQLVSYVGCTTTYATPSTWTAESGYTVSIVPGSFRYWHAAAPSPANGWTTDDPFSTVCGADEGAQKLTLKAVSDDGRDIETLDIIVRKP